MPKTLRSPRQVRLIELLVEQRNRAGLSQGQLAARLDRYQSVVSSIESGGRRVDVVELLDIAESSASTSIGSSTNSSPRPRPAPPRQ